MADVAAKREARRRRILENSEYRLRRITGHVDHDESSDQRCKKIIDAQPTTSSSNPNGITASEAIGDNRSIDSLIDEFNADIEVEDSTTHSRYGTEHATYTPMLLSNLSHRKKESHGDDACENGNVGSMKWNSSKSATFSGEKQHSFSDSSLETSTNDIPKAKIDSQDTLLITIFSSRLIYVILAIIVNFMVIAKVEHLFGTSIVIPFFVVMIGRLCVCKKDDTVQGNNMLMAALILSNVRPDFVKVIDRLRDSFSLFSKIFRDFAVYIFTFVLLYAVLCRCRDDLDDISLQMDIDNSFSDEVSM